jgi:membrane protein
VPVPSPSRPAGLVDLARRCAERAVEVEFVDRSIALASLTFTSLIPLAVVVGAVVPGIDQDGLAESIDQRFDLDPQTARIVDSVFAPPGDVKQTVSIVGVLLLVGASLSFTRGMQRVYERAWQLPQLGVRATPAGLVWILALIVFASIFGGIRAAIVDQSRPVVSVVVAVAFAAVVWLGSPWLLLSRRISWRRLVPTSVLTAVVMTALSVAAIVYMPRSIGASADRYGPIGVAIALVSFLVAVGFVIVGCAAVGAVLGQAQAEEERAIVRSGAGPG